MSALPRLANDDEISLANLPLSINIYAKQSLKVVKCSLRQLPTLTARKPKEIYFLRNFTFAFRFGGWNKFWTSRNCKQNVNSAAAVRNHSCCSGTARYSWILTSRWKFVFEIWWKMFFATSRDSVINHPSETWLLRRLPHSNDWEWLILLTLFKVFTRWRITPSGRKHVCAKILRLIIN